MHLPDQLIGRSNGELLTTVLPVSLVGLPSRKKGWALVNLRVATRRLITESRAAFGRKVFFAPKLGMKHNYCLKLKRVK